MRENFEKSVRETQLPYVKKVKKSPKNRFTHTFYFHVVKKKTLHLVDALNVLQRKPKLENSKEKKKKNKKTKKQK